MGLFYAMPRNRYPSAARIAPYARLALLLLACLGLFGCGKSVVDGGPAHRGRISGSAVVATARSQLGVPYKYGGVSPKTGFDCSGLIYWSYGQYGFRVPRQAGEQAGAGKAVKKSQLRQGDILVFRISARSGIHTALYSGNGNFIHSPSTGKKIREDNMNDEYWKRRYVSARRVL
ncbi:MAG: C40 family peptidase [Deltaproteobacteria bacterium]|jgi:cell wall-associated NlpC family hydrolase|nr:C40 family peptidase [Deltaproteobacteria bacterium]